MNIIDKKQRVVVNIDYEDDDMDWDHYFKNETSFVANKHDPDNNNNNSNNKNYAVPMDLEKTKPQTWGTYKYVEDESNNNKRRSIVYDQDFFNKVYSVLSFPTKHARFQSVGTNSFLMCMKLDNYFLTQNKGTKVVCIEKTKEPSIEINLDWLSCEGKEELPDCYYFMEFNEKILTSTPLGGINKIDFDAKSVESINKKSGLRVRILFKSDLIQDHIVFAETHKPKRTFDGIPKLLSTPAPLPPRKVVKKLDPNNCSISIQSSTPDISEVCLTDALPMMKRRLDTLFEFSRIQYLHKVIQDEASKKQKSKEQREMDERDYLRSCEEAINKNLFQDTRLFNDPESDEDNNDTSSPTTSSREDAMLKYDALSYWLLCSFVFLQTDKSFLKKWFIKAETDLFRFRMINQYEDNERGVIKLIKQNGLLAGMNPISKLEIQKGKNLDKTIDYNRLMIKIIESEEMFKDQYPSNAKPVYWFMIPFEKCLTIFPKRICVLMDGKCIISYKHLQELYLEEAFHSLLESRVNDIKVKEYVTPKNPVMEAYSDLFAEGRKLEKDITIRINSNKSNPNDASLVVNKNPNLGRGFITVSKYEQLGKVKKEAVIELPDIEDCVKRGLLPACQFNDYSMMKSSVQMRRYLKHPERLHHSNFMLDVGYNPKYIMSYFRKYFTHTNNFDKEYSEVVKRSQFKDGQTRYSTGCFRQQSDEYVKAMRPETNMSGCPFRFMKEENLTLLLKSMKIPEEDESNGGKALLSNIVNTAKSQQEYTLACKMVFEYQLKMQTSKKENNPPINTSTCDMPHKNPIEYFNRILAGITDM